METTITINVDTTTWIKQMEELQKQVNEVNKIIVEAWKPIEAFLYYNRNIIDQIARDLGLINSRRVNPRSRIRRYYKFIRE